MMNMSLCDIFRAISGIHLQSLDANPQSFMRPFEYVRVPGESKWALIDVEQVG